MTSLVCALAFVLAQAAPQDRSSTSNNSANRAASSAPSQEQEMAKVKGGRATPKGQWKSGDARGNPSPTKRGIEQAQGKRAAKARRTSQKPQTPAQPQEKTP